MRDWVQRWRVQLVIIVIGLGLLVFYEAAQQYYYITTFNLSKGEPVLFYEVLIKQLEKWLIWMLLSVPFMIYIRRFPIVDNQLRFSQCGQYFLTIIVMISINIAFISIIHIWSNQLNFNSTNMVELMTFYMFQKGPIYLLAYIGVIVIVHLFVNHNELTLTIQQLSDLKKTNVSLYNKLLTKTNSDKTLTIKVKVGNKWKSILLEEVHWVEAYDYCVKLHLSKNSYTQRISMKALESQLPKSDFIRVHRKSIVNVNSIEEFQFGQDPYIKLKTGQIVSIAQSRLKLVRQVLGSEVLPLYS